MPKKAKPQPKKRGRPATGRDPVIAGRVPQEVIKAVDAWAYAVGGTRSTAMAHLLKAGTNTPIAQYPQEIVAIARRRGGVAAKLSDAKIANERYVAAANRAHGGDRNRVQSDMQTLGDSLRFRFTGAPTLADFLEEVRRHLRKLVGL